MKRKKIDLQQYNKAQPIMVSTIYSALLWSLIFLTLNTIDALATKYLLSLNVGNSELNPLLGMLTPNTMVAFKMLLAMPILAFIFSFFKKPLTALKVICVFMGLVASWNLTWLIIGVVNHV